jgi:hypothetical protein
MSNPLTDLVKTLLAKGYPPSAIRKQFAARGLRWQYGYLPTAQGSQERTRRLRQHHLCVTGCGNYASWQDGRDTCTDCLAAKWADMPKSALGYPQE